MDSRRHQGGRRSEHSYHNNKRFRRGGVRHHASMWFKGEGYNDHENVCIAEEVAGIAGFLTPSQPGFKGILKHRFEDYVVHELDYHSKLPVTLQSVAKKSKSVQMAFQECVLGFVIGVQSRAEEATIEVQQKKDEVIGFVRHVARKLQRLSHEQRKLGDIAKEAYHLRQLVVLVTKELGTKQGKEFEQFLEKVEQKRVEFEANAQETGSAADPNAALAAAEGLTFYLGGLNDKADRVFIHETMRKYGKSKIVADTLNIGSDTAVIRVRPQFAVKLLHGDRSNRREWPVGQPDFLQFTLYKRNKDLHAVITQLASMLKVSPTCFSYADVKDKRGITTQLCTVYRVEKERAQTALKPNGSKKLEDQQLLVGDFRYVSRKLELGECAGNRTAMVIRSLPEDENELSEDAVRQAVRSWEMHGFINFFGLQRFGNSSTSHHLLGRTVLRKDYKLAVLLLLRPQEGEASKIRAAREHFRQHKDVAAALRMLPPFLIPERATLEGLQQHGINAHEMAFNCIPKSIRASYVEAYQYFVWNEMASLRISKFSSTSAIVGDLVLLKSGEALNATSEPTRKRQRMAQHTQKSPVPEVVEVTEATVGQYSIDDVVLPLPGHAIKYPGNAIGAAYRKMLTTDGIDMNAHFGPDGSQTYVLDGLYRYLVQKPTRVSFRLERYRDPTKPLIRNDVDRILAHASPSSTAEATTEMELNEETDNAPCYRALVLEFDLGYGSDATIAIRELMKQSSSDLVNWQTHASVESGNQQATTLTGGVATKDAAPSGPNAAAASAQVTKSGRGDMRKIIKAQRTTQVAIGRPGFSLGRS
ncbi:hypothetical protein PsorP6_016495 [Peronosclerospora sorghi]|uniref:Uncharacterized protein n=1 Tax=Peronosclerospora sorghi TaxID=230839 RepID=A0ACC0VQM5_9STRA|nr:hypothetical protein PsorP6_016495 [Peronosclerospora sorghi]